jgi:hypothetical protein
MEQSPPKETQLRPLPNIAYENGALVLRGVLMDENSRIILTTALGSTVAQYSVKDVKANRIPIRQLSQGVYFAGITSSGSKTLHRIIVK